MKSIYALAILLLTTPTAFSADYTSCRNKLAAVASDYSSYYNQQDDKCKSAIDKPPATRPWDITIAGLCKNALGELKPIKARSNAACGECRSVDAKIAAACTDEGASAFMEKVRGL